MLSLHQTTQKNLVTLEGFLSYKLLVYIEFMGLLQMIASDKTFNVSKHNVADVKQTPRYFSDSCNVCTISHPHPYITVMSFGNGITVINLSTSLAGIQDVGWTIKTYGLLAPLALCHL